MLARYLALSTWSSRGARRKPAALRGFQEKAFASAAIVGRPLTRSYCLTGGAGIELDKVLRYSKALELVTGTHKVTWLESTVWIGSARNCKCRVSQSKSFGALVNGLEEKLNEEPKINTRNGQSSLYAITMGVPLTKFINDRFLTLADRAVMIIRRFS